MKVICDVFLDKQSMTDDGDEGRVSLWTSTVSIPEMHEKAESLIAAEMNKRGIDGFAFRESGRICRKLVVDNLACNSGNRFISTVVYESNGKARVFGPSSWPDCIDEGAVKGSPNGPAWLESIGKAETAISCLEDGLLKAGNAIGPINPKLLVRDDGIEIEGMHYLFKGRAETVERLKNFFAAMIESKDYCSMKDFDLRSRDFQRQRDQVQELIESQPGAGTRIISNWLN